MKTATIASVLLALTSVTAAPTKIDYTPPGGWEAVKYPKGTGENLDYYPPPPGGWESIKYPPGTGEKNPPPPPPKNDGKPSTDPKPDYHKPDWYYKSPFYFTSVYRVTALGKEVVNGTAPNTKPTPGPADAVGWFNYGINVHEETICWNITLLNVPGQYKSPASTATHIHQAVKGATGPPRIAFPNPVSIGSDKFRRGVGCLVGPFKTGVIAMGKDTGDGFSLAQIEANPAGFFTDVHTDLFTAGVVRGQLG